MTWAVRARRGLSAAGILVRLRGKPLQALALLLERAGEPVTRDELRNQLRGVDTFVDFEDSLNRVILRLRQALDHESGRSGTAS